jgi:hypothetical protein
MELRDCSRKHSQASERWNCPLQNSSETATEAVLHKDSCFGRFFIHHNEVWHESFLEHHSTHKEQTYLGFMLEILSPLVDLTHSLLINRPVGCVYLTPLGAVSSTDRPDILRVITVKSLEGAGYLGKEKEAEERRERYIENKKERGEMPS